MKEKIITLVLILLVIGGLSAKSEIDPFTKLRINNTISVVIKQGTVCELRTEGEQSEIDKLKSIVYDNKLTLGGDASGVKVYITVIDLESVDINGAANLKTDGNLNVNKIICKVSGAANITMSVTAKEIATDLSGAGKLILTGTTDHLDINISGAGKVNADGLVAKTCKADISGAGKCSVNVTDDLQADLSGAGNLYYKNKPATMNYNLSGTGRVAENKNPSGDTTKLDIGGKKVLIVNEEVTITNDDSKKTKKVKDAGFNWAGIDVAFNGLLTPQGNLTPPAGYEYLELNQAKSLSLGLNILNHDFKLVQNYVMLMVGAGLKWEHYRLASNSVIQPNMAVLTAIADTMHNLQTNKLRVGYITLPALIGFNTSTNKNKALHIATGVQVGLRTGAMTKLKYSAGNETTKPKTFDDFNTRSVRYDVMLRLRYKNFNIFGTYALNSLFASNQGPDLRPASVGISLTGF